MRDRDHVRNKANIVPLLAVAVCAGCTASPPESRFDGARAFGDLEAIVAIGPRPPGSGASERTRAYIRGQIEEAGLELKAHPFIAHTPRGDVSMTNLVVEIPGTLPGIIVIGNHYDTKFFADFNFVGANDGGSTTAWMIEFARAIGPQREGRTVWLCWFDGEEAFLEWSDMDSLYGSREMVSRLQADDRLGEVQAMINLDMIGDCQLSVFHDAGAPEWLVETIAGAARETGNSGAFIPRTTSTEDDHVSFRKAGVPAINLIDFYYGGGSAEHHMNWHTSRDRIDLVCAESLQAIGEVMLAALPRLDRAPMDRGRGE